MLYLRECVVVSTSYFDVRCLLVVVFCIGGFGFSFGNVTRTHAHILFFCMFYSNFILFLLFLGILHSTCVFESSFGFILDCNFRKSSLFRVRNLGGVKAHFGLGKCDVLVRWIDESFVNFCHQINAENVWLWMHMDHRDQFGATNCGKSHGYNFQWCMKNVFRIEKIFRIIYGRSRL